MGETAKPTVLLMAIALAAALVPGADAVDHGEDHACEEPEEPTRTLRVDDDGDADFRTIQAAIEAADPGDTVAIRPGNYSGVVDVGDDRTATGYVETCHLTIRGTGATPDEVVLWGRADPDGPCETGSDYGLYAHGVRNVTFERLTALNYRTYGFYWHEVDGFYGSDLRAGDNCVYGIIGHSSRVGEINGSEAWGSGDSGLYVGEISDCDCVLRGNDVHGNVIGYSGTRANHVVLEDNRFHDNVVGILPNTLPPENVHHLIDGRQDPVQCCSVYRDNVVEDNDAEYLTPSNPDGDVRPHGFTEEIRPPSGVGVMLAGASGNLVYDNVIRDHDRWGLALNLLFTPPSENTVAANTFAGNGLDVWWDEWGVGNCFEDNAHPDGSAITSDPEDLPSCGPLPHVGVPDAAKEAHLACLALEHNLPADCSGATAGRSLPP